MIRFSLRCERDHAFDSWFRDGAAFDELARAGHVMCPTCGSTLVEKGLMSPAVVTSRRRAPAPADAPSAPPAQPVAVVDERATALRAALKEMREHLLQNSRNVGSEFADEARRVHEGRSEDKAVHGTASREDVEALLEDGIRVMPLPVFPEERN